MVRRLVPVVPAESEADGEGGLDGLDGAADGTGDVVQLGGNKSHSYAEDLEMVKTMARTDPKIVANVVKDWVTKE